MKNLLSQFLNYLSQGKETIEKSFCRYPIILDIFVSFFRTLLYLGDVCSTYNQYVNYVDIYSFLSSYFDVDILQES